MIKRNRTSKNAFALPTVLIASIIMLTVLLVSITSTAALRTAMTAQYYNKLTQASNDAGMAYAKACLASNNNIPQWNDTNKLKPDTDCSGIQLASCPVSPADADCHFVTVIGNVRSTFTVGLPEVYSSGMAKNVVVSASTNLLRTSDSSIWRSYSQSVGFTQNNNVLPFAPTGLTATGGVTLNWTAPTEVGNSAITGYRIYRSTSTNTESAYAIVGNVTTYTDTSVSGGTTYYYKVAAINSDGEGALSGEVSKLAPTGQLVALASPTIGVGDSPSGIAISPDGKFAYVVTSYASLVYMYSRDTLTGALTALSTPTIGAGSSPFGIVISPDGLHAYVTSSGSASIYMYSRNVITGILSPLSTPTIPTGSTPVGIAMSPDGKSVYATTYGDYMVYMFSRNSSTGLLAALSTPTVSAGTNTGRIVVSPDGTSVYTTNSGNNNAYLYNRNTTTGILVYSATISTGALTTGIAISADGASVYIISSGLINMYSRSIANGTLTALVTPTISISGSFPLDVAVSPDGLFVYAIGQNLVNQYSRNTSTGALAALAIPAFNTGSLPTRIAISPDSNSVYVGSEFTGGGTAKVSMYARN